MSSRRTRQPSTMTDNEINDLVARLHELLPHSSSECTRRGSTLKILKEICTYLKKLHGEVDDLSKKLSQLLESNDIDVDVLSSLLQC